MAQEYESELKRRYSTLNHRLAAAEWHDFYNIRIFYCHFPPPELVIPVIVLLGRAVTLNAILGHNKESQP